MRNQKFIVGLDSFSNYELRLDNTVQPVLSKPCIKQAPVLSKHFHFPPIDFT